MVHPPMTWHPFTGHASSPAAAESSATPVPRLHGAGPRHWNHLSERCQKLPKAIGKS